MTGWGAFISSPEFCSTGMEPLLAEIRAIRRMLEYVMEYVIGVEEPEEWERRLIEEALQDETLGEDELWAALGSKSREEL